MKLVLFYHSLISDWNHGNAHFLRGIVSDLLVRGHEVRVYEPQNGWSVRNLLDQYGEAALHGFVSAYPELSSEHYRVETLDLDRALDGADVAIVHEWNDPELVRRIGLHVPLGCRLFFHDTHHRSVTQPESIASLDLRHYDGVLAFGQAIAERYRSACWAERAWIWHEAADARRFRPLGGAQREGDLVWIGNWGDAERTAELHEYLIDPVAELRLRAKVHGVRYPQEALDALQAAGIRYGGWVPNYLAPHVFAQYACTVHVPRRAYADALRGIPTIRVFEALACGIPLVCAPWSDEEGLFRPGIDYLVARNGARMREHLNAILSDPALASSLASSGRQTILARHTCAHRVDELLSIVAELNSPPARTATREPIPASAIGA